MAHVRKRTRSSAALANGAAATTSPKKRKNDVVDDNMFSPPAEQCSVSHTSDESPASCCSSNGSLDVEENKIIKFSDPEVIIIITNYCYQFKHCSCKSVSDSIYSKLISELRDFIELPFHPSIINMHLLFHFINAKLNVTHFQVDSAQVETSTTCDCDYRIKRC